MMRWTRTSASLLLISGLWAVLAAPGWAGYKPPRQASRPKSPSTTTGTRGCSSQSTAMLMAIAPQQHVGQTTSVYPTFVWFMPDEKPYLMEFELYELTTTGRKNLMRQSMQSQFGLMQLTLPKDQAALVPGKQYLWQAIAYCNKNRPSSALVAKAELTVQKPEAGLTNILAVTTDPLTRAEQYAEAGFWYDAMREAMQDQGSKGKAMQNALLQDLIQFQESKSQPNLKQVLLLLK